MQTKLSKRMLPKELTQNKQTKQTKLKLKIKLGPIGDGDAVIEQEPIDPPLERSNAAGRLVLVPPHEWPGLTTHGWVAKIMKCEQRSKDGITTLKFHDATEYFTFLHVQENMKPLS